MKKQFFRVKQLADQAIARAEKSEVLTEDLAASERRVEALRSSCSVIRKRLTESLSGHGTDDVGKRLRKIPEHQLGAAMKEGAGVVGQDTVLGAIMHECGEAQTRLAQERLSFEQELESTVLDNSVLQQLLDSDIPNVTKLRKTLARLTLDMDASRSRYQNAQRHSAGAVGAGGPQQKVETARDELETAQVKVEQHRDTLAGDMFQLLSREPELAQLLLQLVKLQTEHYRSGLQLLEATIPGLTASLNAASQKPVFGLSLEEHLRVTSRQVALPLEMCVCRLLQTGADEEGLFRVAGSTSKARKLKSCFDAGLVDAQHMLEYSDPHVVADALKAYLRDLPDPLMATDSYDDWMAAARVQDEGQRLQALWQVLHQLPDTYYVNLRYLIKFLALLCKNKQVNKMTTQNMAIVMAPNLLWTRLEEGFNMTATGTHSLVVDALIVHADWFFTEDVDFFITYPREPVSDVSPDLDSPVLSNGAVRPPGHHRSKSSDSGVTAVDSSATGESTGSTASLTSDPSALHCESPRPTLRRKKQAAPAPPAHRQTIATVPPPKPEPPEPETEPESQSQSQRSGESEPIERPAGAPQADELAPTSAPAPAPATVSASVSALAPTPTSGPAAAVASAAASVAALVSVAAAARPASFPKPEPRPVPVACPTAPPPDGEPEVEPAERPPPPVVPPVPAPRTGLAAASAKVARPDRPPPPAKMVERTQSCSPADGGGVQRQKPALPERPDTLKKTRNSSEVVKDLPAAETTPTTDGPSGAPPPIGWVMSPAEVRSRQKPTSHPTVAPPPVPVPAPRTDSTQL